MYAIAHEPITKSYSASIFSRSFCITYICYILVLVIPLTILINIGYSWPLYKRIMITPELNYMGYQSMCLTAADAYVYDSSIDNDGSTMTYTTTISVGRDQNELFLTGNIQQSVTSCTINLYFYFQYEQSIKSVVQLPLNFYSETSSRLSFIDLKGNIKMESTGPIPQSSILTLNQTTIASYGDIFSMDSNFLRSANNNITIALTKTFQDITYDNAATAFSFTGHFKIFTGIYFKQTNLLDNLRSLVPYFMYIVVFLWLAIIRPLVEWMLKNKIYSAKLTHEKLKAD